MINNSENSSKKNEYKIETYVMDKVLNYDPEISEFELLSCFSVYFRTNTF